MREKIKTILGTLFVLAFIYLGWHYCQNRGIRAAMINQNNLVVSLVNGLKTATTVAELNDVLKRYKIK